ncbi:MAG: hypothetical protein KAS32_22280, partial [Candidatus Peribacteraceae bacterium]|nr:hypothetical protein [Candidatus Peribacteraceae bacterium]
GGMGAKLGAGQSVGEALDPSQVVGDISAQKAGSQILSGILPTPVGQKGPDAVTTKQTADGTTTTITEPSEANLGSFGSTTPAESIKATPPAGGQDFSPFFRGLLE